jgi:hypothetical protein
MIDEFEEEKDTEVAVSDESLDGLLEEEADEEEVEADLTDEFGNPKEDEKTWE